MVFSYEAYTRDGEKVFGSINANKRDEVAYILYQKGLMVSHINSAGKAGGMHVKEDELIVFTRLLANGVEAHIPITRALEITTDELSDRSPLKAIIQSVLYEIKTGKALSEAFQVYHHVFSPFYVSMIRSGEKSGKLGQACTQILIYLQKRSQMRKKITSALMYPAFVFCFAILILTFFVAYLIPKFQESYSNFGSNIPVFTTMIVNMTTWIRTHILWIIGVIGGLVIWFRYFIRTDKGKLQFEKIIYKMPIIGDLLVKDIVSRFTRTLSVLLSNGVTLTDTLELVKGILQSNTFEIIVQDANYWISEGKTLASALKQKEHVPSILVQMVAMGEESGRLAELMGYLSEFYEKDVDVLIEKITSMITPVLIIFIGLIIAVLVIGLYLPIFDMSQMMK